MTTEPEAPGWRDMYRDNPYYFTTEVARIPGLEPVDVPARLRRGAGGAEREGTSHHTTWKYVLRHARETGIRLVHGRHDAGTGDDTTERAWVELDGGIVFDGDTKQFYAADPVRAAVRAEASHAYSAADAARLMLKAGHPGPWSDDERLALDRG